MEINTSLRFGGIGTHQKRRSFERKIKDRILKIASIEV